MKKFRLLYVQRRIVTRQVELIVSAPNAEKAIEMGNSLIESQGKKLKAYRLPEVTKC